MANDALQLLTFLGVIAILIIAWLSWRKVNHISKAVEPIVNSVDRVKNDVSSVVDKIGQRITSMGQGQGHNPGPMEPVVTKLYAADWCPACKNFVPTWNKVVDRFKHDARVVFQRVDMTTKDVAQKVMGMLKLKQKDGRQDAGLNGYPTVTLSKGMASERIATANAQEIPSYDELVESISQSLRA